MHFRNSCGFGLNGRILQFCRYFQETCVTRSLIAGKVLTGCTVIVSSATNTFMRVMQLKRGLPLISTLQEPHFPALHGPNPP
jgi:hypothetical protein